MNDKEIQLKLGTATEKNICKTLRNAGYWVYNMPMKNVGQPCDIVALKGSASSWLIDGKHVRDQEVSFSFSRIEPNQISSMQYASDFAKIKNVGFVIFFDRDKQLRWFPYAEYLKMHQLGCKSVNMNDLELFEEVIKNEDINK